MKWKGTHSVFALQCSQSNFCPSNQLITPEDSTKKKLFFDFPRNLAKCNLFLFDLIFCSHFIHKISKTVEIDADPGLDLMSFLSQALQSGQASPNFLFLRFLTPLLLFTSPRNALIHSDPWSNTNWGGCPAYKAIASDYALPMLVIVDKYILDTQLDFLSWEVEKTSRDI